MYFLFDTSVNKYGNNRQNNNGDNIADYFWCWRILIVIYQPANQTNGCHHYNTQPNFQIIERFFDLIYFSHKAIIAYLH